MNKGNVKSIWQVGLATCLAIIEGAVASYLGLFQGDCTKLKIPCSIYYALVLVVILIIAIALSQLLLWGFFRVTSWVKTPNRKNIKLGFTSLHDGKICHREWRKPFIVISAIKIGCIDGLREKEEPKKWTPLVLENTGINKWKCREFDFVRLSEKYQYFSIVREEDINQIEFDKYKFGEHTFSVCVVYDYKGIGNDKIKWFDVTVFYELPNQLRITKIIDADK